MRFTGSAESVGKLNFVVKDDIVQNETSCNPWKQAKYPLFQKRRSSRRVIPQGRDFTQLQEHEALIKFCDVFGDKYRKIQNFDNTQ